MSKLLFELKGSRGRSMKVYDRKVIIQTSGTVGSFVTGNATDGIKTIFYKDVVGIQYKPSGFTVGYLQFETASAQMNNLNSNAFSENTFTFEDMRGGIPNDKMNQIYEEICDLIEDIKYREENMAESRLINDESDELPDL